MTVILMDDVTISSVLGQRDGLFFDLEKADFLVCDGVTREEGSQDKILVEDFFKQDIGVAVY